MLRKLISGVCVLSLVCLMVGCTEDVKDDNINNNQQDQQEEVKEDVPESNLDKAYDLVMDAAKDKFVDNDEYSIKVLKDEGKLIIQLTLKNVTPDEMLQITNAEWNKRIENDAKETVQALIDGLKEAGITDVECVEDIYIDGVLLRVSRVSNNGIIEDNFEKFCSNMRGDNRNTNQENETTEEQNVNSNFYIGNDGCYHCKKCDTIPSKAEYYENTCDTCNGNTSNEEIGQCYDCGEFKPISEMTFNGRSYHCGCLENMLTVEEGYNALVNYVKSTYGDAMECQCEITAQGPDTVSAEVMFPDGGYWGYVEINLRTQEITSYPAN